MTNMSIELQKHIGIINLENKENLINPDFIDNFNKMLDQLEEDSSVATLVVRSTDKKIFTLGLDFMWALDLISKDKVKDVRSLFYGLNELFTRILLFPMPTIAAINGHVFGIGVVFSCVFDFRFMRSDRGFLCLPEVDMKMPFLPGMIAVMKNVIPNHIFKELIFSGMRITAKECLQHHIINGAYTNDDLFSNVIDFAKLVMKDRTTMKIMKERTHKEVIDIMRSEDKAIIDSGLGLDGFGQSDN